MNYAEIKYPDIANGPGVKEFHCLYPAAISIARAASMRLRGISIVVYTTRTLPRKMTKAQIEEELGCTIEIIPDESERVQKNA